MKHCPKCLEEFVDSAARCADCNQALVQGAALPDEWEDREEHDSDAGSPLNVQRPADSEVVLSAPAEYAEPVALALSRAGIPALVFDCAEPPEGIDAPLRDVVVPATMYNLAVWFCRGFEAAAFPADGDEGKVEVKSPGPA